MGNTSSQPEPFPEIPEDFGDTVPETPNPSKAEVTRQKKNKRLSSTPKASSPAIAEANGANRSPELDSNMSNPSKRKRESEPERKQKAKKHRKSEKSIAYSDSPENNPPASEIAVQTPPTPSQPIQSKPKAKKVRQQNGEELKTVTASTPQFTPDLTAVEKLPPVKQLSVTKQTPAPDSPNPEGITTPGGSAKEVRGSGVRGSRTREKDNLRIGFYTPDEVQKIEAYKLNFCTVHGIPTTKFDEMVQHSERGAHGEFPVSSDIISKGDFWDEIYALVPDRDRRSVYRFMRRHFQASAQRAHDWSKEQDDELIELHAKHGPKWTYIGRLIGRSDDDVTQRWKNKLEHQGTMNTGAWSEEETKIFLDAMESAWLTIKPMLANNAGKDMYQMDEGLIIWGNISKAMGHRRSRQQCADKWRKIVRQVMIMRANGQPGAVFDPKIAAKKSAHWNMRLEAQRKSSQFVNEDSDDDEATKTTTANLNSEGEVAPSPIANNNVESEHEVQSEEGEPDLPVPPKKANKSKSKRKHDEDATSSPIKEAPSSSAAPKKGKEERKREKKEQREKERQEQIEEEAQDDKAARRERKRKKKEEKKRKRLEEEERLAAEANEAPSSDDEASESPKKKKSKKQKQASVDRPALSAETSRSVVEESPSPASPASHRSATEQDVVDETDSDGGDDNSSEVNVKYETDSDEL
ncbi:hypothetical protein N7491_005076 [Penicillium cf. griseofulvum]|uniref:Uncharacterized protein n=1 Tax=Penicillium cf. griseofulvum TaxID=2972120 RepID=A0A9W9M4C6_9EURO|nr:hypothetical protein N7472_007769 [Penicillium cf. griseofulvum]KAJ5434481.1 hypothetical protein N7491_005076 [Penicillium cf. griseofulvum]KAJ5452311.1 hypothetical protein N7445_000494 [Penicillium cf. griseofulvum]